MLIVALNGSPNKEGGTHFLLKEILKVAKECGAQTEYIHVASVMQSLKKPFCVVCSNPCSGECYRGTALEEAYRLLSRADGVVFGSPVYFGTVSGQMKAFWDMSRKLRSERRLLNTVGAAVTTGAAKYGGQETTLRALHDIMLVHGMIIIGDGYRDFDAGHHGVAAQRPAASDEFALKRTQAIARRMVEVCEATRSLRISSRQVK